MLHFPILLHALHILDYCQKSTPLYTYIFPCASLTFNYIVLDSASLDMPDK